MPGEIPVKAQPFVVMVKPVGSLCNLRCSFCYYLKTNSGQSRMSDATLERFIQQYIKASPGPIISFTWHGGEPSLAGLDFYKRAVELQKHYTPEGWKCWNNIQTNGILLDDEWCAFLAEERFDIGLSIDGTSWIHDKYRKDQKGGNSYEYALSAVRRLQTYGIQPDLLCTVTSDTAKRPLDVYKALRALNTGWIQFIPIIRRQSGESTIHDKITKDSVSGRMYGDFLCAVFDEWILHDLGRLDVQFFAETMRVWSGGNAGLCTMTPTCGRALIVEQDGSVYSCDHFVTSEHRIGDINTTHLGILADSTSQIRFGNNKHDMLPAQCLSCQWLNLCNGGCPKDRFIQTEDGEQGLNHLCEGFQQFFSYIQPVMNLVTSLTKLGHRPQAIMNNLRDRLSALWKGVGRNDPCPCKSGRKAKHCCWLKRPITG